MIEILTISELEQVFTWNTNSFFRKQWPRFINLRKQNNLILEKIFKD